LKPKLPKGNQENDKNDGKDRQENQQSNLHQSPKGPTSTHLREKEETSPMDRIHAR
jgi:hypothetical protein